MALQSRNINVLRDVPLVDKEIDPVYDKYACDIRPELLSVFHVGLSAVMHGLAAAPADTRGVLATEELFDHTGKVLFDAEGIADLDESAQEIATAGLHIIATVFKASEFFEHHPAPQYPGAGGGVAIAALRSLSTPEASRAVGTAVHLESADVLRANAWACELEKGDVIRTCVAVTARDARYVDMERSVTLFTEAKGNGNAGDATVLFNSRNQDHPLPELHSGFDSLGEFTLAMHTALRY